jgi:SHS family lactate transporter-like MFS transporter
MISIACFSVCNLLAGLAPTFSLLLLFRAILGIGMGAEWPAGASLAMETWPQRSRGFMGSVLQGSWGLGALLSSAAYGLLYDSIGWRGLLLLGVLPALLIVYIRKYVKEPGIWIENRRQQREQNREFRVPLFSIFKRGVLGNTVTACWMMASAFVVGYSVGGMFPSYLQKDLHLPASYVALPIMLQSLMFFISAVLWGWFSDRYGRRLTLMITCLMAIPIAPLYLMTSDYTMIVVFFTLQGFFGGGGMHTQWPHYLAERFPTEVRATATGFCYHQGAVFGGLVAPVLSYLAVDWHMGFAMPMLIGTMLSALSVFAAMLFSPETKGTELVSDIQLV